MKLAHLACLLAEANDIPKSDLGWIKCTTLSSYDGPGVSGNFDTHLNQIVAKHSFTVTSNGLTHTLNDTLIRGLVSRDNHRLNRFQPGHFTPGRSQHAPQLVIRLTPPTSTGSAPPAVSSPSEAHSLKDLPLTLADSQPYGICF